MNREYLVSFGLLGDFGCFRAEASFLFRRGERVVVRTPRGLELGEVLREASSRHAHHFSGRKPGPLLRRVTPEDESLHEKLRLRAGQLCVSASNWVKEQDEPLAILDAELLLDSSQAILHIVRWQECDLRPLVSHLSRQFAIPILLEDLGRTEATEADHGCGSCGSGGCGSCGTGGCGSCAQAVTEEPGRMTIL